jgi:acyl-CoA reductase-like NAD-dependent aldehyde dehydrogenase
MAGTQEQAPASEATSANGSAADHTVAVTNPATGEVIAHVPDCSAADIARLARQGRAAQPGWEALGFDGRARVLRRAQKWLLDNSDRIIDTIMSETGKSWEDAGLLELSYGASAFGFWAKHAESYLADERVRSGSVFVLGKKLRLRYRPLGLIGVIGPWNYPLVNSFGDCIPALAAGNSVILKPSELTPLTSLLVADGLQECGLPEHVFQVATGTGDAGRALVDEVDMIMFTGSTATGRKVAQQAAARLIPASLELGGKDPMIVLADADLERAANSAVFWSMQNAGQTCISVERVYVEEPVYDAFVEKVVGKVKALRQGPPGGPGSVEVGTLTSPPQLDIIERHVKDAVDRGARVLAGGHRGNGDTAYEPTVLVDVDHAMLCMTEETFGPTLPIMKVRDAEEAIKLANDSPYGLSGSVFSRDVAKGEAVARRVESGAVCVNDVVMNYSALELPFGGWKASGLGSRHGANGIRKYCAQQSLLVSRFHLKRDVQMFPYSSKTSRGVVRLYKFLWGRGSRD